MYHNKNGTSVRLQKIRGISTCMNEHQLDIVEF